jgi:hypothetical protein
VTVECGMIHAGRPRTDYVMSIVRRMFGRKSLFRYNAEKRPPTEHPDMEPRVSPDRDLPTSE